MSKKQELDVNRIQLLLQMHDKGMVSTDSVLKEMGIDADKENKLLQAQYERQRAAQRGEPEQMGGKIFKQGKANR